MTHNPNNYKVPLSSGGQVENDWTGPIESPAKLHGQSLTGQTITCASFQTVADNKLQTDVCEIADAVAKIQKIRGVDFIWKYSGNQDTGVMAQEVIEVMPNIVSESNSQAMTVDYGKLTALLVQAVKEQQKQIDELKAHVEHNCG